ncbi:MAG: nucleotidyltransferase domain-containing protein [Deltaproteobacteria bacterium]|nr:nucleotidyltransferase domain-containing protein [Deltaproteobacteria bacterium]
MSDAAERIDKGAGGFRYEPFRKSRERLGAAFSPDVARATAERIARTLVSRFGAERVLLFGSLARAEFTPWSDIDLAAEGIPAKDFYRAVAYAAGASAIWKVDLVDMKDCPDSLRNQNRGVREGRRKRPEAGHYRKPAYTES